MRKVTTQPPPRTVCEALAEHIKRYNKAKEREYAEAAAKEGISVKEWHAKQPKRKEKEVRKWHKQDDILKGLKKPKKNKRKLIIVEEAEPIIESHYPIVEPAVEEITRTTDGLEPEPNNEKMVGAAPEPEPLVEETTVKAPMPKPKSQAKRLKMTMKKINKKKKLVKKAAKPKEVIEPTVEGEAHYEEQHVQVNPQRVEAIEESSDDSLQLIKVVENVAYEARENIPDSLPHHSPIQPTSPDSLMDTI